MARFRLVEGVHYELNPELDKEQAAKRHNPQSHILHSKDAVIESDRPLDKLYPNKFVLANAEAPGAKVDPVARKLAIDKLIAEGVWRPEDRQFLQTMSDDGFRRICRQAEVAEITGTEEEQAAPEKKSEASTESPTESQFGDDVTREFTGTHGFKVFRNAAGKHQVVSVDNQAKPINEEPLEHNKVGRFLRDHKDKK